MESLIKQGKCDFCGAKGLVAVGSVQEYDEEANRMENKDESVCRDCDPRGFEAAAQADKDAYLAGAKI